MRRGSSRVSGMALRFWKRKLQSKVMIGIPARKNVFVVSNGMEGVQKGKGKNPRRQASPVWLSFLARRLKTSLCARNSRMSGSLMLSVFRSIVRTFSTVSSSVDFIHTERTNPCRNRDRDGEEGEDEITKRK